MKLHKPKQGIIVLVNIYMEDMTPFFSFHVKPMMKNENYINPNKVQLLVQVECLCGG